ncbi:MAG: GntR family transcriptional regulator [Caulobacter sp.]|nr:GntR family transcriptional regulator [Caulobacter sp.]
MLAPGGPRPIVRQIADQIRLAITTGELAHGARLPSVRALAGQLLVNSNTVARAYSDLASEGWLQGQHGQGMFVAGQQGRLSQTERRRRLDEAVGAFVATIVEVDLPPSIALAAVTAALQDLDARRVA